MTEPTSAHREKAQKAARYDELRARMVRTDKYGSSCGNCGGQWGKTGPEKHNGGDWCIYRPLEAPNA